jgi:hypothetical protein
MNKRLLDYDPATGLKTFHSYDETEDKTYISYEQDVQPILDRNKAIQNHGNHKMGDGYIAASIPCSIMLKWLVEYGVDVMNPDHGDAVKRLLNSSDWRHLKRTPFTI